MKLIFIHGSGGCKESFYYQTQHFTDAEAINLPGHPEGDVKTSIDGYVEWLKGYIQDKGYKDVVLAGHSLGSGIVLLYALKHPEDLKGIVTLGGGARLRVHPIYLEMFEKALAEGKGKVDFFEENRKGLDPELNEILKKRSIENGLAVAHNDMLACDKFDILDCVHEITVPTLAICGTEDQMTPPKYSNFLVDKIPGAEAVIIQDGTHMVFAEKPKEVNHAIEDFCKKL